MEKTVDEVRISTSLEPPFACQQPDQELEVLAVSSNHQFKNKRGEYLEEIRRQKRSDMLMKRRTDLFTAPEEHDSLLVLIQSDELKKHIKLWSSEPVNPRDFAEYVVNAKHTDILEQYRAIIHLRRLLVDVEDENELELLINTLIDNDLMVLLLQLAENKEHQYMQAQAAWILAKCTCSTAAHTLRLIDKGAIALFLKLMISGSAPLVGAAIWALGNVVVDVPAVRDHMLEVGAMNAMLEIIRTSQNDQLTGCLIWVMTSMCKIKPYPDIEKVAFAMPFFCQVMLASTDEGVLSNVALALEPISKNKAARFEIARSGILPRLVELLGHNDMLVVPCLRILGNICVEGLEQIMLVVETPGYFEALVRLLDHELKSVKKDVLWSIANIIATKGTLMSHIFNMPACIDKIVEIGKGGDPDLVSECLWIMANSLQESSMDQFERLCATGLPDICILNLNSSHVNVVELSLICVNNLLRWGKKSAEEKMCDSNHVVDMLEECGAVDMIQALQTHPDFTIYEYALATLEQYFDVE